MIPTLLVDALAAYRITRLITADKITEVWRDCVVARAYRNAGRLAERPDPWYPGAWTETALADDDPPKTARLVTCRWCMGVWVAVGVVAARRVMPRVWAPAADTAAVAAAAVLIARAEDG